MVKVSRFKQFRSSSRIGNEVILQLLVACWAPCEIKENTCHHEDEGNIQRNEGT